MGYLERSCEHLEHYISKIVHQNDGVMESGHIVSLKTQVLRDTRSDVEQLIDVALTEKVSVILDDGTYFVILINRENSLVPFAIFFSLLNKILSLKDEES